MFFIDFALNKLILLRILRLTRCLCEILNFINNIYNVCCIFEINLKAQLYDRDNLVI